MNTIHPLARHFVCCLALFVLHAALSASALAQTTNTWDGGGSTNTWLNATNWSSNIAPSSGNVLIFSGSNQPITSNDFLAGTLFNGIRFTGTSANFTLSGNSINLANTNGFGSSVGISSIGNQTNTISLNIAAVASMNIQPDTGNTLIISGNISESGGAWTINKLGGGTLILTGTNSFSGATFWSQAGTLSINSIANIGTNSALGRGANVVSLGIGVNTAELLYTGAAASTDRQISIGGGQNGTGGAILNNSGSGTLTFSAANFNQTNAATGAQTLTLAGSANGVIQGIVANNSSNQSVSLTKTGAGTWTLSGNNTYTGNTLVSGGTLQLSPTAADFPRVISSTNITVANSGTLSLTGGAATNQGIALANNSLLTVQNGGTLSFSKIIVAQRAQFDTGATISNSSNLLLGATNQGSTYTLQVGGVNLSGRTTLRPDELNTPTQTLYYDGTGNGASINDLFFQKGLGVATNLHTLVADIADGSGAVDMTVGTFTANTFTASVSGRLQKQGAGVMLISNAAITTPLSAEVSAGTLLLNGTANFSTMTVNAGGTLGGSATIVGATTISGNLAPGNSPGLLTFSDTLTLNNTAVTTMEIVAGSSFVRGTDFDAINVGGLLTYDGALVFDLTGVQFGYGNYSFNVFDAGTFGGDFDSVNLSGLYSGALTNSSGTWTASYLSGSLTNNWTFRQTDGVLALEVVPEPSTYALLTLAAAGLGAHVMRRRRHHRG